jgi:hypothetical protein
MGNVTGTCRRCSIPGPGRRRRRRRSYGRRCSGRCTGRFRSLSGDVVEVNCGAHTRRYFFKALASDPERAKVALGFIGALFRIERTLADSPRRKKEKIRDKRSRPIADAFFS